MTNLKAIIKFLTIAMIALTVSILTSCGGGGSDDDNTNIVVEETTSEETVTTNSYVGTWLIQKETTSSFWIFNADGSFEKKRAGESATSPNHFVGTYSVTDGALSGSFKNPGVGTGEIKGTIAADGKLAMDFIEYWHSPAKVVPCVGVLQ